MACETGHLSLICPSSTWYSTSGGFASSLASCNAIKVGCRTPAFSTWRALVSSVMKFLIIFLAFSAYALAAPVYPRKSLSPGGTGSDFAADPSINVVEILAAAKAANKQPFDESYRSSQGKKEPDVKIFGDWKDLPGVSAFFFTADMDVDCDGPNVSNSCDFSYLRLLIRWLPSY